MNTSAIHPTLSKLSVRDGFDEDDLTDIDDEVFIRDGKNGCLKLDEDGGVKRPLMPPRRKCKRSCKFETHRLSYKALLAPLCYGTMALVVLLALIILCILTVNIFPMPVTILRKWLSRQPKETFSEPNIIPCTSLATKVLWTRTLPKLTAESPLRSNDVDADGIDDVIIGFSSGLDATDTSEYICALYFDGQIPCAGGVLALNGKTGETLWTHWTANAIFSVDCDLDLTNDKTNDCVVSGFGGTIHAINGRNGSSIWEIPMENLPRSEDPRLLDVYDARFIADVNGDGYGDVIASHAVQTEGASSSEILIISGSDGSVLRTASLPDTEQLVLAPQTLIYPDGESVFVLTTISQKSSGGLYIVPQVNLMYGDLKLKQLHRNMGNGTLLPPILVDITSDGIEDVIAAMFNSTIVAYNGLTFEQIWNYTIPNSEVISIPIPGYYNDDNVPDFMVKHQIGPGFLTYYYTTATIIDGKTGKSLLEKPVEDSLSRQMSGLSVTVEGYGNDWFLHWSVDCLDYEGVKQKYEFLKGEDLASEARADLCKLRFNSTLTTNLFALSQHVGPPGVSLYFSEDWKSLEFNNSVDPKIDLYQSLPSFVNELERSARIHETNANEKIFKNTHFNDYVDDDNKYANPGYSPNDDDAWKRKNKWLRVNMQGSKDYEVPYDDDGNPNVEDLPDYPPIDQLRQQRYTGDETETVNRTDVDQMTDTFEPIQDYLIVDDRENVAATDTKVNTVNKREINISQKSRQEAANETTEADTVLDLLINAIKTQEKPDTLLNSVQSNNYRASNFINEETSIYNVTDSTDLRNASQNATRYNYNFTNNNETISLETMKEATSQTSTHNFRNIAEQDQEEDADIEEIFKRESLKNRNRAARKKRESKTRKVNGVQKQPPTGILLPSISKSKQKTSVDLVFSTFWLPSSKVSVILLQQDLDCIHRKKILSGKKLRYKESDDIVKECLSERGVNYKVYQEKTDRENLKLSLGQMTVYRMKLECVCPDDMLPNESCKNISTRQSWPEHLGSLGNGYFKPLQKLNT